MRKLWRGFAALSVTVALAETAALAAGTPATEARRAAANAQYAALVNQRRYPEALRLACATFGLPCRAVSYSSQRPAGLRAATSPLNHVSVYRSAFVSPSSGEPHIGWLGALVGHELVHTRQSLGTRSMNRLHQWWRDYSIDAALELEAWGYMRERTDVFGLTCTMVMEIEQQLYFYRTVLARHGRMPKDENEESTRYALPFERYREIYNSCVKIRAK